MAAGADLPLYDCASCVEQLDPLSLQGSVHDPR